jgi:ubiquinone/menaquinone biosynthesis C-methylase UbiE
MRYKNTEEAQKDHIDNYRSDGIAKGKGTMYSADYQRVQFVLGSVPKDSYVLEVGCNGGTIALQLLQAGCYVKGIDIVQDLVDLAKKRGVMAEQGTAEDLSNFPDDCFDAVVCAEVLEHLYDPLVAIKEAYRVLKPGGVYVVTVPSPEGTMAQEKVGDYHQQNFSMEILDTLFNSVFKEGNVEGVAIPYTELYANRNGIDPKQPQWTGLCARKEE